MDYQSININILVLFLNIVLGVLFFFQGYDKIFRIGLGMVSSTMRAEFAREGIPMWTIKTVTYLTSFIELIAGASLILGLFKPFVLYILAFDIIIVSIAFSLKEAMWDMQLVFPRIVLLGALLLLPVDANLFSLDYLLN